MREGTSVWILPRAPRSQTLLTELQLTRKRNDDDMMMILAMVLRWRCTQHEFWKWASKSKCLDWSFQPADLNVSPSKCLRKIAHDLHSHNFRPLSDRIEVLRKRSANLNIRGLFAQLEIELPRCWGKNHPVHAMQCRSYKCKWCSCFWSAASSTFP